MEALQEILDNQEAGSDHGSGEEGRILVKARLLPWQGPVVAAAFVPCAAYPALSETEANPQRYLELIAREQDAGGPSSRALIEPMHSLGLLYLEEGRYELAAETLARARGIMRATDGFDTLTEAP